MIAPGLVVALLAALSSASACEPLTEVPASVQVAWISPVRATVGAGTAMQVVRSVELQALARANPGDAAALLKAVGLVGPKAAPEASDWKVSFFDVSRDVLCRPMEGVAGDVKAGVPICEDNLQKPWRGTRGKAWTGCGYLDDVASGARSLDVFRVRWEAAVREGFCLLPLARLLSGRPA